VAVGDNGDRSDGVWIEPPGKNSNVICDMVGRIYDGDAGCTQLTDEDLANAELIASAPADISYLLEQVDTLRAALRQITATQEEILTDYAAHQKCVSIAVAALSASTPQNSNTE
jgi:hypothetical protein